MNALVVAVIAIAGLPVSLPVAIVAIIVIALILALGSILLFRNGGKKGSKVNSANEASDWQRQAAQQPGAAGGWNQQGAPGGWNQQGAPGQAAGNWGQPAPQQGAGWGAADAGGNWGAGAQQPGGWGAPSPAQPANSWNTGGNPAAPGQPAQPAWGAPAAQQPAANAWGNQGAQVPWDQAAQPAQDQWGQPAQDQWGQPAQPANSWGAPAAQPSPQQGQQAPAAYGNNNGPSWGGQAADPWAAQAAQQPAANAWGSPAAPAPVSSPPVGTPPWQQGGFGQAAPGMMQDPAMFANNDGDKTMLRTTGPQGGLGFVRVEEGKEPGRIYEVRKESLSIGRSRESDIFLEDLAVSRLHASIVNMGNGNYALKDEGSANGTKVNGQLVSKNQTYPLQEGDRVQLGQTTLVFGRR